MPHVIEQNRERKPCIQSDSCLVSGGWIDSLLPYCLFRLFGLRKCSQSEGFLVPIDCPERIVLRQYGDTLILAEVDLERFGAIGELNVRKEFSFVKIQSEDIAHAPVYYWMEIGTLRASSGHRNLVKLKQAEEASSTASDATTLGEGKLTADPSKSEKDEAQTKQVTTDFEQRLSAQNDPPARRLCSIARYYERGKKIASLLRLTHAIGSILIDGFTLASSGLLLRAGGVPPRGSQHLSDRFLRIDRVTAAMMQLARVVASARMPPA